MDPTPRSPRRPISAHRRDRFNWFDQRGRRHSGRDRQPRRRETSRNASAKSASRTGTARISCAKRCRARAAPQWQFSVISYSLISDTEYHFRIVARNVSGTSYGSDATFTTAASQSPPPPIVTKLAAKKGPAGGGTPVTITGGGFTGVTAVKCGATNAASFEVVSENSIAAISPEEMSGRVDVKVTTPSGTSTATSRGHFTFGSPTITKVSPSTGPTGGGTPVTITGSGFALGSATLFSFGKVAGTAGDCISMSTCTVTAPAATRVRRERST